MSYFRTYFTANPIEPQYSVDQLYENIPINTIESTMYKTIRVDTIPQNWFTKKDEIERRLNTIFSTDVPLTYTEYNIPKHNGKFRKISAPNEALKQRQKSILDILNYYIHAHDAAYAYVKNRSCKDAIIKHQSANTNWFYKFDLKDFFPNCNKDVLSTMFRTVYPFCILNQDVLDKLLKYSLYKNALPQGSVISPMLTNMIMVPFDWAMTYSIKHFNGVYTRYADDLLISLPERKDISFLENIIINHLDPHLKLNKEKSRCGSLAGHNFNLGLILNKDRNITIGHDRKLKLKAKINNFIFDFTNDRPWSIIDTQVLLGEVNYFKQIEPEYAAFVLQRLQNKYHCISFMQMCKQILSAV